MTTPIRIHDREQIRLSVFSAVAADVRAQVRIDYDDGTDGFLLVGVNTTGTTRALQNFDSGSSYQARGDGHIVTSTANFEATGTAPKRGQTYGILSILNRDKGLIMNRLCRGYIYGGAGLTLGQDDEALDGPGVIVTNQGETTLVNNTTATRVISVPTNARWHIHGGDVLNADDVTRDVTVACRDGSDNQLITLLTDASAASLRKSFPHDTNTAIQNQESTDVEFDLSGGFDVLITWTAGGASAGGTGESSVVVEEWIEE